MQAFKAILTVSDDGFVKVKVPQESGSRVEVIVLAAVEETSSASDASVSSSRFLQNGFCTKVLAVAEEDVWNDL